MLGMARVGEMVVEVGYHRVKVLPKSAQSLARTGCRHFLSLGLFPAQRLDHIKFQG
jgi:hypothetical protein